MDDARAEGERVALRNADSAAEREERSAVLAGEARIDGRRGGGEGSGELRWSTVDGPLGVHQEDAVKLARNFFYGGFCLLPWLWFVNCVYFWPLLRFPQTNPDARFYVVCSGLGCLTFTLAVVAWSLTFAIGGEDVFGNSWKHLAVYNLADKFTVAWSM